MATVTINNPNPKPWVELSIPRDTATDINLANGGAYLFLFVGGNNEKDIFITLTGSTGNTSVTRIVNISSLTVTTGTSKVTLTQTTNNLRNVYVFALNNVKAAYL